MPVSTPTQLTRPQSCPNHNRAGGAGVPRLSRRCRGTALPQLPQLAFIPQTVLALGVLTCAPLGSWPFQCWEFDIYSLVVREHATRYPWTSFADIMLGPQMRTQFPRRTWHARQLSKAGRHRCRTSAPTVAHRSGEPERDDAHDATSAPGHRTRPRK